MGNDKSLTNVGCSLRCLVSSVKKGSTVQSVNSKRFYAPNLKGPPKAFSNLIVCLSVYDFVPPMH